MSKLQNDIAFDHFLHRYSLVFGSCCVSNVRFVVGDTFLYDVFTECCADGLSDMGWGVGARDAPYIEPDNVSSTHALRGTWLGLIVTRSTPIELNMSFLSRSVRRRRPFAD